MSNPPVDRVDDLNDLAWAMYGQPGYLKEAEALARQSLLFDSNYLPATYTLSAVLIRLHRWDQLGPIFGRWLREVPRAVVAEGWPGYLPLFCELLEAGQAVAIARLLKKSRQPFWQPLSMALKAAKKRRKAVGWPWQPAPLRAAASVLLRQLYDPEARTGQYPDWPLA
jgi:hypothetical protein